MPGSTSDLPHIDEHATVIAARADEVWSALGRVLSRSFSVRTAPVARVLGAMPARPAGDPLREGSALTGFHVHRAKRHQELILRGRHRFSEYELAIRLEPLNGGRTLLRAETRAEFPGLTGRVYRALVIGSRGHVLAVDSLLRGTKVRAQRAARRHAAPV